MNAPVDKYKAYKAIRQLVMDDLAAFCCQNYSTIVTVNHTVDPYHMAMQEGKRQVLLYIMANRQEPKADMERKEDTDEVNL